MERWAEYINDLFNDDRIEKPTILKNMDGPKILKSEVESSLHKLKRNKAAGPDEVVTVMMIALEDYGIDKLTDIVNEIYDTGVIPEDLSRSIFIALPKKPGATECELHRTISLMSHMTKLILKIIMMRARCKIRPEIGREQCGFVEDSGTRNAIFMVRMISERAIEMQKDVYMCFIDYTKAFDNVKHDELFKLLSTLDINGKDLRLIRNLYWEQTACMRVGNDKSEYVKIQKGVRQGCVFSPDLFNLYSEMILRELKDFSGFVVGGNNINNLRYADDTVLMAESQEKLQTLLNIVVEVSKKRGLSINCKKTKCMVVSKRENPHCEVKVGDIDIEQVTKFNYLGSFLTEDGKCDMEIRRRIGIAKNTFMKLGKILRNGKISMHTKKRVQNCYVEPVLLYGSECWTISAQMESKLQATELWFYRRMMKISWVNHVTNEEVLRRAGTERKIMKAIRKRQIEFLGHVMRKEGLEELMLTGRVNGKRSRERQRLTYLESLSKWMTEQVDETKKLQVARLKILRTAKDRELWRTMVVNVRGEYDT